MRTSRLSGAIGGAASALVLSGVLALSACAGSAEVVASEDAERAIDAAEPTATATPEPATEEDAGPERQAAPFVPAGPVGSAEAYEELIARIELEVPPGLRSTVPWPDLRHPDPATVQVQIFDLWIWMAEHHPDPALVEVMAVAGSPSREEIVDIFGDIEAAGTLHRRDGAPYVAWDHRVFTLEAADLPLWLSRGAPADAVVVYYEDRSGPITIVDRETGDIVQVDGAVPQRSWLSIMVPTDVGWLLFRDQLIEPGSGLEAPRVVPDPTPDQRNLDV